MIIVFLVKLFLVVEWAGRGHAAAQDECLPKRCGVSGPDIRFPFWLKDHQPEYCGYPGFQLSCNRDNVTEFDLQFPVTASDKNLVLPLPIKVSVNQINYASQQIRIGVLNTTCLPKQLPSVNSSASPFKLVSGFSSSGFTLFNCSLNSTIADSSLASKVSCLSGHDYEIYAVESYYSVSEVPLSSCAKMYNISYIPNDVVMLQSFGITYEPLGWSEPNCNGCEARGQYCRSKNNGTREIECFDIPKQAESKKVSGISKKVVVAIVIAGLFALVLVAFAVYRIVSLKRKKEDQKRIERFLEDYKALRPTRYTYADIKKITDQLKEKLGQGGYGTVYKGKLSNDVIVAVKILSNFKGNGDDFINEVNSIGRIHHVNVVRLVGFCADGYKRALVYEFLPNDSLDKFILRGDPGGSIGWEKLQNIAVGIAKGIDYLHQGCNQRILHFDIKPHNILLDHNFNPKVADFGLAKLCSKEQSIVTMTAARGTIGYIAPEVFSRNFGNVSYKSDVYSYGMLLLDVVGGRKQFHASAGSGGSSQMYFPEWMYSQLEKGEEIAVQIEKEDDSKIIKKLGIVGLWCIQWYPADRPSMKVVIQMLEGENTPLMPPNPFASTDSPSQGIATTNDLEDTSFTSESIF